MNRAFWKGKTVLVTGHTGIKGSWLSLWLHALGAKVIGFALQSPSSPSLFEVAAVGEKIVSIHGDVCDLAHLVRVCEQYRPELVIHMAAQALVRESYRSPVETYETNVMGTVKVLDAARQVDSVRVVVSVTSDKCYENQEWDWGYRENEPMGGHDPYSSSKGCAELVAAAYRRSFFAAGVDAVERPPVHLATVRAGNVICGGDWAADRLVPDVMQAFLEKRRVVIRYPGAIRPWQHVLEPLAGYLLLAEEMWKHGSTFEGGWNFGAEDRDARPVSWIVERLANLLDGQLQWEVSGAVQPHEARYLKLDCSKAKNQLGWSPLLNLSTALEWVVRWYQAYQEGQDMFRVTREQIERYEGLLRQA
ncbi:CDP-glucose 4,6-dehydratase [Desulfogranum mediterraneum]|uniref:CDP-glucose 4,6-dehydratase n=1 Tax=Desulfogranum mediterraneum TaxID=160661 RepID=UPI001ABF3960|nr:CDP-glucose 4,6-dehydratase [Desulfogranum mediterraneum]